MGGDDEVREGRQLVLDDEAEPPPLFIVWKIQMVLKASTS
jgi:hypothetical protein